VAKENINKTDQSNPEAQVKKAKSKNTLLYKIVLAIIVIIGALFLLLYQDHKTNPDNSVVFVVNGQKYTQKEVSNIISYPLKLHSSNRNSLSLQAYNYIRREQGARTLNIEPSNAQISQAELTDFGANLSSELNKVPWIRLVSYDTALQQNLGANNLGTYQGYSLIFWFGQHLAKGPAYTPPDFGNKTLIASDKSYANSRANYYYNKLKNSSMTPSSVLSAVQNDSKLSFALPANKFLSQSIQFGLSSNDNWRQQVFYPDIANYISTQSKPGLSTIHTGKISIVNNPKSAKDYADGYYYIVQLDIAKQAGISNPSDFSKVVNKVSAQYMGW